MRQTTLLHLAPIFWLSKKHLKIISTLCVFFAACRSIHLDMRAIGRNCKSLGALLRPNVLPSLGLRARIRHHWNWDPRLHYCKRQSTTENLTKTKDSGRNPQRRAETKKNCTFKVPCFDIIILTAMHFSFAFFC